jgi:integrase
MPAHIKKRADRGGIYYLVDGSKIKSLETTVKRLAQARLEQYIQGKYGLGPEITVGEYFKGWIETKREPLIRRSRIRDYNQSFACYILPEFSSMPISKLNVSALAAFRAKLLGKGLKVKTVRNIIASSFRALWRDAMAQELTQKNPFALIQWPKAEREIPDPFTALERERIVAYFGQFEPFYYAFVRFQFETGMRPSESTALAWADLDAEACTVRINKSRNLNVDNLPKTTNRRRIIVIGRDLMDLLGCLRHPWQKDTDKVFINKLGNPLTTDAFRADYFNRILDGLKIRRRKFYATRHTFITEHVKAGQNLKALADYCGTSVAMIEAQYCGKLELDQTISKPQPSNVLNSMASTTGISPIVL